MSDTFDSGREYDEAIRAIRYKAVLDGTVPAYEDARDRAREYWRTIDAQSRTANTRTASIELSAADLAALLAAYDLGAAKIREIQQTPVELVGGETQIAKPVVDNMTPEQVTRIREKIEDAQIRVRSDQWVETYGRHESEGGIKTSRSVRP